MVKNLLFQSFIAFVLVGFLASCSDEVSQNMQTMPTALGKMNEIVVVADQELWDGPVGDSIQYYFASSYPIMPSPEPFFDLRHFTPEEIKNQKLKRELRTYMIVGNISDENANSTKMIRQDIGESKYLEALEGKGNNNSVGNNRWARNQLVIYLYANSDEALAETIRKSFSAIAKRVNMHDLKQLSQRVYARPENLGLTRKLKEQFGINLKVPGDFQLALEKPDENLIWLRKDDPETTLNFILKKIPYTDKDQISKAEIKRLRDEFGNSYVSTDVEGSFMRTNDVDLPMYDYTIDINGMYALEARGIWEINNDFMGGPFISYLLLSPDQKHLYFIDAFVFAPGKAKRDLIQQLEHLAKGITIEE